jgi:hypothetical protein
MKNISSAKGSASALKQEEGEFIHRDCDFVYKPEKADNAGNEQDWNVVSGLRFRSQTGKYVNDYKGLWGHFGWSGLAFGNGRESTFLMNYT